MKRWSKYIKPYISYFILGPLCMIVEVVGEILMPYFLSRIVDVGIVEGDWRSVTGTCVLMVITAVVMMLGGVGGAWYGAKASVNFSADLRHDLFGKVQKFSFANIDKFSTGSLVTRLTNDVTQLQNFINMLLRMCLRSPGMLIGALIMAIRLNPRLASVLAVSIPLVVVVQIFVITKGFPRFAAMQEKIDKLNSTVQENITNMRVVKSFVREDYEKKKFGTANKSLKDAGLSAMGIMITSQPLMMIVMNTTVVCVLVFGGRMIINGTGMSDGTLIAFINYITQILFSLMMVSMMFVMASRAIASGKRICEVLDERIDIDDESASGDNKVKRGEIEFRNVSFRYFKNSEKLVLDNINLKIEAGKTVGIVGSTGCGKTTLVSMIPRLYDPDSGDVLVDGVSVREYKLKDLRDGIGMVLQKNTLFSGTIAENLRWGDENASDEDMIRAAQNSQADIFVRNFTDGYDTVLDAGGTNVSGGQKQRLCIARALLKNPQILIFDDSTSAVDTATEAKIRHAFKNELAGSTKIIIAQRVGSVMDADKIIVMDDGVITGIGTHSELLESNTEYQEIYYSQMEGKSEGGRA